MSVKRLYQALGLTGYDLVECWEDQEELCVVVELPHESLRCRRAVGVGDFMFMTGMLGSGGRSRSASRPLASSWMSRE